MLKLLQLIYNICSFVNEWANLFLIGVGTLALVVYWLQESKKKIDAASLIVSQIDELQERIREISTYVVNGQLNAVAFYESLPLMDTDYWNKYKHYFVREMDSSSYTALNHFYEYVSEIQEQQLLMKSLQKNIFNVTQNVLADLESKAIFENLTNTYNVVTAPNIVAAMDSMIPENISENNKKTIHSMVQQVMNQNPNFDFNQFWTLYQAQKSRIESVINQNALTHYIPEQIRTSLEKMLKKYSMLEITGKEGYRMLKKTSERKL